MQSNTLVMPRLLLTALSGEITTWGQRLAMAATIRPENRPQTDARTRRFYERYVEAAQHTGNHLWDRANKVTHGYVAYLAQALKNFVTKGTTESVVFGYWAMFSLFPLVMLGVVVASFALGP